MVLAGARIRDAGLVHLEGLAGLQRLNLGYTKITDAGLVHLKGLAELQVLTLIATRTTDAARADLMKALPMTTIRTRIVRR